MLAQIIFELDSLSVYSGFEFVRTPYDWQLGFIYDEVVNGSNQTNVFIELYDICTCAH